MNSVIICGRLTAEPEIRITQTNKKVCQFTLAVDAGKDESGQRRTQFHDFVAWEAAATYLERYVKKGNRILVQGKLDKTAYEKDGQKRYSVKVIADRIEFADGANQPKNEPQPMPAQVAPQKAQNSFYPDVDIDTDDLPF